MAFVEMALFYWLIDVLNYRKWAFFFKVIGMNSLVIYFANHFIDFRFTAAKLFDGILVIFDERWHDSIISLLALGLVWLFLYFLYRNKLFLKI
jgi:predicted acyltransferase